jgi:hypothetical protein
MSMLAGSAHLLDTLRYTVRAEKSIAQDNVRVVVAVQALVSTSDRDQQALEKRIRAALADFLAADWAFTNIQRQGDAVGYERVALRAMARVKAAEIYSMEERARKASREGLTLSSPQLDYSLPARRVEEVTQELRLKALEEVGRQIVQFNAQTGRNWRLGDVQFTIEGQAPSQAFGGQSLGRQAAPLLITAEDAGLSASEKIVVVAEVTLKAAPQ